VEAAQHLHEVDRVEWEGERTRLELDIAKLRSIAEPSAREVKQRMATIEVAMLLLHTRHGVALNQLHKCTALICWHVARVKDIVLPSRSTCQRRVGALKHLSDQQMAALMQAMAQADAPVNVMADGGSVGGYHIM
jgi:hypothetical protein